MGDKFMISFDTSLTMTIDEIWPDGDAPENPGVEDVLVALEESGSFISVLNDWCFPNEGWDVMRIPG